jgi:hypothetical protein
MRRLHPASDEQAKTGVEQARLQLWKLRTTEHAALDQVSRFCTPLQVTAQTDGQKATFLSQGIFAICVTNHIGRCRRLLQKP